MLSLKPFGLMKDFSQEMFSTSSCHSAFLKHPLLPFSLLSETGRMQGVNEDYWQLYRVWNHFVSAEVLLEGEVCRRVCSFVWGYVQKNTSMKYQTPFKSRLYFKV